MKKVALSKFWHMAWQVARQAPSTERSTSVVSKTMNTQAAMGDLTILQNICVPTLSVTIVHSYCSCHNISQGIGLCAGSSGGCSSAGGAGGGAVHRRHAAVPLAGRALAGSRALSRGRVPLGAGLGGLWQLERAWQQPGAQRRCRGRETGR